MARGRYRRGGDESRPAVLPRVPERPPAPPGAPPWPPRPRPPWQRTVVVVAFAVGLAVAVPVVILALYVRAMSANHAELEARSVFDDGAVVEAVARGCATLAEELRGVPATEPGQPRAERAAAIRAENDAIAALVATVRQAGRDRLAADPPGLDWLADWERLAAARAAYARDLDAGRTPSFGFPADVLDRMNTVGNAACGVPDRLSAFGQPFAETTR